MKYTKPISFTLPNPNNSGLDRLCTRYGYFIMDKICGIYKITSPKKRFYIGQSVHIRKRWSDYKHLKCKDQLRLYNSLKKYGVKKHKFEILHQCEPEKLNELEVYYIKLFQCFNNEYGLNLRAGGNKSILSPESKKKISESLKGRIGTMRGKQHTYDALQKMRGRKLSDKHRKKLSESAKKRINKPLTQEHKNKISKAHKGIRLGCKLTIETRHKMSEAHKKLWYVRKSITEENNKAI